MTGCLEFRMSHEDALKHLEKEENLIRFDTATVDQRNIHYAFTDIGRDSIAIFIHGSPGSWSAFIDFFSADSLLNVMDILAIDRAGFGDSDYGNPEASIEKQAFQMHSVVSRFPQSTKILIGHSLGGPVVARMAMDFPEDYEKIILVSASVDPELEVDGKMRSWLQNRFSKFLMPTDFWVSNEEIVPLKSELTLMSDKWSDLSCQVVAIHGTSDSLVPKENVNYLMKMIPDSLLKVVWLPNVDHFIPWTDPEEIIQELIN